MTAPRRSHSAATTDLILGSASRSRAAILRNAGVAFTAVASGVDEDALKERFRNATAGELAERLAEVKARAVGRAHPDSLVLGADQVLELGDVRLDKPRDRAEAEAQLATLSGREHVLTCGACLIRGDRVVWRCIDSATLAMRPLGEAFIEWYLDEIGDAALDGPGAYRVEALGAQLFTRIEGDFFTVLGLPLFALLAELRRHGVIAT